MQLAAKRTELLVHTLPDTLRSRELRLTVVIDQLIQLQRKRVRSLQGVLPLRLRPTAHGTIAPGKFLLANVC